MTIHKTVIALSAAAVMTAMGAGSALAAPHHTTGSSRQAVASTPVVATTNVKPTAPVTWVLPHAHAYQNHGLIVVSNANGSTLYALTSGSVHIDTATDTLTWTPPAEPVNGTITSVLGRYTEDSVAWIAKPAASMLTKEQVATLQSTGTVTLPGVQLADLIQPHGPATEGEIATVQGSTLTFFGGETVTLSSDAQIQMPGTPHATLSDLKPGQLVKVQRSKNGQAVQSIHVVHEPMLQDTVLTTGSNIGEPVNWTAVLAHQKPSVINGDTLTVTATDSYGDPATTGSFAVDGSANPLSSSFAATSGTIADGTGSSAVVDHKAQAVAITIHTQGPAGRDDQNVPVGTVDFQPGPAAKMTLNSAHSTIAAGMTDAVSGVVTDIYGNPVAPTTMDLTANTGAIPASVTTEAGTGAFTTSFTAPRHLTGVAGEGESVTISAKSATGAAQAQDAVAVNPGPVAHVMLQPMPTLLVGQAQHIVGTATDQYGNAVLNHTPVSGSASAGTVLSGTTTGGQFSLLFTAPNHSGSDTVTVEAGGVQQSESVTVVNPIPSGAVVTLAQPQVASGGQVTVTGTLKTASGQAVSGALLSIHVTGGTASAAQVITDGSGGFTTTVTPTSSSQPVTITASGATISGTSVASSSAIDPLVYGNQSWTDTGIPVTAGQKVTISDTGSWASDLYARVGTSGAPVKVGADGSFVTAVSGTLYLGTNGTTQSGNVDALVSVGGVSGVVPTMDLATGTKTVTANGTTTVSGQVMMGTTPVVDAPVTLSTTSGTFNDPSAKVIVYTNGEGHYSATFNAPASGSPIISAEYTPSTGSAIQQTAKLTVGNPIVLQAGSQSLIANSGSSTVITGTLTNDGSPLANTPVSLSASNGSLSASTTTTNSEGQFSVTYTAGSSAGTAVITATAGGVAQSIDVTLTSGSSTDPSVTGTMQLPFFSTGTTLAPGWTLSGSAANYSNYTAGSYGGSVAAGGWSNISGSGSASYQFTVPSGQTATLTYGIPAGGFQNNDPANISVNGQLVASVNRDIATVGSTTSSAQVLWSQTFSPGTYTITIASGASGVGINVYGLWTSNTNISAPSSTTNTTVSIASVMDDDFVSPYTYGTPTDAIHPTNPGVVWFFGNAVPAGQYLNVAVPTQNAGGFYFQVDGGPGIYGIGAIPQSDYSSGAYHFSVPVQSWAEQDINIWNYSDVQSFSAAPTLTYSAKPVYPVISGMW